MSFIYNYLYPKIGGGSLRRYYKLRKEVYKKHLLDQEHLLKSPLTILDFNDRDDIADVRRGPLSKRTDGSWRISDDEVIGGFSRGSFRLISNKEEYKHYLEGGDTSLQQYIQQVNKEKKEKDEYYSNNSNNNSNSSSSSDFIPFIRWNGNIDTDIGTEPGLQGDFGSHLKTRSGFCSIRLPEFGTNFVPFADGLNIKSTYNALELTCRPDHRIYTINLKVSTYFPDDLYQSTIHLQPNQLEQIKGYSDENKFSRIILPFQDFILTCYGRERQTQRILDGGITIESIGITIMDNTDGPFTFDLAKVRCVNYFHNEILGEDDDLAPYPY